MRNRPWIVGALLFGSGFCALVYQVGWLREFRLIFGASTAASAAVLAMFIGGLGIGGLFLGPRADRHARPLLFYSSLEMIVAISAALTPFVLDFAQAVYLATGGSSALGSTGATIVRLVLSAIVLAVPTVAMGGTLPAAGRAATRAADVSRRDVATLYALNTLGAVVGCLIATFALLEVFGTRQTLWLAAAVNMLIALVARALDRKFDTGQSTEISDAGATTTAPTRDAAASASFLITASAATGFAFFLMELVWYRLLAPLLGGSVFTFGLVLAIALAGIGLGGLLYAFIAANRPATLSAFAASCLLEAVAVAATYALGDRVAVLAMALLPMRESGFAAQVSGWTLVASLIVLPPAVVAGYQFPLLIALFGRARDRLGRQVGVAYAANTAGAIAGSLAGGFGLLPWLSAPGAWRLVAVLLLLLAAWAIVQSWTTRVRRLLPQVVLAGTALALLTSLGPTSAWRHGGIGAGRVAPGALSSPNRLRAWTHNARRSVEWDRDGVESGVALALDSRGYSFVVNGKADGSARGDAGTQVMLGLLGALHHPAPTRALVIGLGTGSTAGWLAAVPSMRRVDVVELEPVVLDVAQATRLVNRDVLHAPGVHVTVGDARETLLTSRDEYDVIASEPSNPYRAGIASLFTREYYTAAYARLTDDGVFAQWVQAYEIDPETLRTIYTTLGSVFANIETWQTSGSDLVLIATKRPRSDQTRGLASRLASEPYKTAIANVWRATDLHAFLAHRLGDDSLTRAIARERGAEINTDDRNVVEFGLARSVGRSGSLMVAGIRAFATKLGANRAPVDAAGEDSSQAIDTAWVSFNASEGWFVDPDVPSVPAERSRQLALRQYFEQRDMQSARVLWGQQQQTPRDLNELAMAADLEAEAGSDAALPLIEQLRAYQAGEADTILTALCVRQGRFEDAATVLESVLVRFRTDPWPLQRYKEKAVMLADTLGRRSPAFARRMFEALRQPLALRALDDLRLQVSATLAMVLDSPEICREPIGALDAHVLWDEGVLRTRRDCYRRSGDKRVEAAERDLDDFLSAESMPLDFAAVSRAVAPSRPSR